ncbi:MAG: DUF72 domain-containing protein [Nitrososphaerota archaeon]|nr:DUF72 domain-containing protein [Nitrososphaerota archaeon]
MELLTGTGGWHYYGVPGDRLRKYSKVYDFVEVNSTFYANPSMLLVAGWRRRAREGFEFTVKCNRTITHERSMLPGPETEAETKYMIGVCAALKAGVMVLQTPPSLSITRDRAESAAGVIRPFLDAGLTVVLEHRGMSDEESTGLLKDMGVVYCTDLTSGDPPYSTGVSYSRLFGPRRVGFVGFGEEEFLSIEKRLRAVNPRKAYLTFHGMAMYADAANFMGRASPGRRTGP